MFEDAERYVSLSNKYRPQTFEDMVGQETISKTLANAIKLNRIGHAYLFYGPRGCGKTTTARILAKALNCTGSGGGPSAVPCGKCPQCLEIAAGSDLDVLELDAASNTQVEKIREAIIDTVALAAARDRYKIFILDEVHMLSDSSFNALLKTVEEPPSHVIFILATTEKHKVPATISSRCQTFRFRPITQEDIAAHLSSLAQKEKIIIEEKAVKIIAAQAGGALRDALTMLDRAIAYSDGNITEELVRDMLGLMPEDILKTSVRALFKKDAGGLHEVFEILSREGYDPLTFLHDLKNALGSLFYAAIGHGQGPFAGAEELIKGVSPSFIAALTRKINKVIEETKFADAPFVTAEVGLFTVMDSVLDIDAFVARLEKIESALEGGTEKKSLPDSPEIKITPRPVAGVIRVESAPAVATVKTARAVIETRKPAETPSDWKKFKTAFKDNFFIFDALSNCAPSVEEDAWEFKFNAEHAFYATALEVKIEELRSKAREVFGREIDFTFTAEAASPKNVAPAPSAKPKIQAPPPPAAEDNSIISKEEPFIKADFSYAFEEIKKASDRAVPDYVQKILNIIPGEVIS